jgi:hypothetical protein
MAEGKISASVSRYFIDYAFALEMVAMSKMISRRCGNQKEEVEADPESNGVALPLTLTLSPSDGERVNWSRCRGR